MNIFNLLIKEKHIAGVEINDDVVRIAYFRPLKKNDKKIHWSIKKIPERELILIEENITPGIISGGKVIDKDNLGKTLRNIWNKAGLRSNYAIIAIPENKIYSRIFSFPKTVNEIQLKEAIALAIDFQLPIKKEDNYIGYENAGDSNIINEFLVSGISKNIANGFIDSLNIAGIKILALESHLASIARSIKLKLGQAILFTKNNPEDTTIFILKDSSIRFSRTIPGVFSKQDNFLTDEVNRIKNSFESEKDMSAVILPLAEAHVRDEYLKYLEINGHSFEMQSKWLIAIGCAIRGEIPKGQDNHISLLPVGTAEAYAYQKATTFTILLRNLIISVSIFFLFTYLAAYLLILALSQTTNKTSSIAILPITTDISQKESYINNVNLMTSASSVILSATPTWSILLDDINSHIVDGIVISNFSVKSINDKINIIGIAKDRDTLNQFKKSLQNSTFISTVELPITNLEQKGNIPFSITFMLRDPSMLYFK